MIGGQLIAWQIRLIKMTLPDAISKASVVINKKYNGNPLWPTLN